MRSLVTGAGGFIGANLVRALSARGDKVHACVRSASDSWRLRGIEDSIILHEADVSSREDIERVVLESKPELVFHLAHYGGNRGQNDGEAIRRVIIDGTAHLYEACMRAGTLKAIVHAGTSSEYGAKKDAMREDMVLEPDTEYGVAKAWATLFGEHLRREKGVPITTLRFFSVYGPYEAPTRFFPAVILSLLAGMPPSLSNPSTVRDFVHVDDVINAFLLVPEKEAGIYNIGTGLSISLESALSIIQRELGSDMNVTWGNMEGRSFDSPLWQADIEKAREVLGWKPKSTLEEGVRKTVAWFKEHRDLYAQK
ncbi:MAG: dTDP-glucose 4,6-dehydratase [Parcubacteria group bacterium GW2011_GWA2_51_10]|nr:MAG: dTDP-glucose 4,6-dehydratase [Parcubacteria group bacterium GW2011_GWA2_51_10]